MPIQPGERVPDVRLAAVTAGPVRDLSIAEAFAGKRVLLIGVPGAFSPTCSDAHLPGFQLRARELLRRGIDLIACVVANDAFVARAWARERGVGDEILMLADGNGELARALDLELDLSQHGMRTRSARFVAVVDDGVLAMLRVEPEVTRVTVTGAEAIAAELASGG